MHVDGGNVSVAGTRVALSFGVARFVRVARAVTGDRDSALEAVQEGFADALRNSGQWQGRGPLAGWVWRCV